MKQSRFPPGWDDAKVRRVLEHYEHQTEDQAVAEDEAAVAGPTARRATIPTAPVSTVRPRLTRHQRKRKAG